MTNYSNLSNQLSAKTNTYINTASFPTTNISPGTKAIDQENDLVYYYNGSAWFKLETTTAPVRTYTIDSNANTIVEGDFLGVRVLTTNVAQGASVPFSYYYKSTTNLGTTTSTPITGNFTIDFGGASLGNNFYESGESLFSVFEMEAYTTEEISKSIVFEVYNSSVELTIDKSTIVRGTFAYGEQLWTNGESGTWTVPDGITSISVVALGGGGRGREKAGGDVGGGGGALAYSNNIAVTPGEDLEYYTTPAGNFLGSTTQTTNARSRLQRSSTDLVSAEPGMIYEVANDFGATGTGGRASASTGDVKYDGGDGRDSGFFAYGGSAAGWAGSNTVSNATYSSGRGGYGTGPYGSSSNGSPDYTLTPPINSNNGGTFGGGAGGLSPNAYPGDASKGYGSGGGGFVRVIYPGDTRQFPNTEANKRTPRTFIMTGPKEIQSGTTFTIEVLIDNLISGIAFDVVVSGSGFTSLTESYTHTTAFENNKTIELNFTAPTVIVNTPITFDLVFDTSNVVLSLQATITI